MGHRIVIYGFLGCGKTTLINHLLREVFPEQRVVVLENESGRESVDGDFLRNGGTEVVDLKAGCVCCTLRCELAEATRRIEQETAPDLLILEPSGISALEELLRIPGFVPDGVVTLIDVARFDLLMRLNPGFYARQFRLSPVLLLTKADTVPLEEAARVRRELERINPDAFVAEGWHSLGESWWREDFFRICGAYRSFLLQEAPKSQEFFCETFPVAGCIRLENLETILRTLESEGRMPLRVKGLIHTPEGVVKADAVGLRVETSLVEKSSVKEYFLSFWWAEPADKEALRVRMRELIKSCLYE